MPTDNPLNIAVIIGSTRTDRFCPTPAKWIAKRARQRGDLNVDVIDLKDAALPEILAGDDENAPTPAPVKALQPRLAEADAFIVVTPVYNRGYPASLKNAIDWYFEEWSAKPVGFVSYGGIGGGLSAVEQLRAVFNEVHAATIRNTISFDNYWDRFDDNGETTDGVSLEGAAKSFMDQLNWWAYALRDARNQRPFTP
ncbi:NAD(P)H-dependent oxidoreductase [Spiractinospora alimapuensis]|uniref:NADPH-dependent FMN reductase n=1 Tax=Spiractinospora alimapuensis TaxID=2820884 RepID=UPI001F2891DF|nr:NAD(P)H-dependent oxidoreductase [Spiractinospora alimapuensis]QVQ51276.1 NAD(P)H-dependent oxidoreductase [Spiractinospora alimapuensis]